MPNPTPCCPKCGTPVIVQTPGSQGGQGATGAKGDTGPTGSTGPVGLVWAGTWSSVATYAANNAVYYGGSAWVALQASTNVTPTAGAFWSLLALGQNGATGPTGTLTPYSVYASGTAATVGTTAAPLTFGTTSPSLMLPSAGTYIIFARLRFDGTSATTSGQSITTYVYDSGASAIVPNTSRSFILPTFTTTTATFAELTIPVVVYAINAMTTIALWANLSGALGAGTLTCVEADLVALLT